MILVRNLGRDAELSYTPGGAAAARGWHDAILRELSAAGYGGIGADGRTVLLEHVMSPAGQAPAPTGEAADRSRAGESLPRRA